MTDEGLCAFVPRQQPVATGIARVVSPTQHLPTKVAHCPRKLLQSVMQFEAYKMGDEGSLERHLPMSKQHISLSVISTATALTEPDLECGHAESDVPCIHSIEARQETLKTLEGSVCSSCLCLSADLTVIQCREKRNPLSPKSCAQK